MVPLKPLLGHLSCRPDQPTHTDWPVLSPIVCTHVSSAHCRFCAPASAQPIAGCVPLGGPTFRVLNLASHPLLLLSFLSLLPLSPCSSSSSTLANLLLLPTSPVQHKSFCWWHPTHTLRGCPPLLQEWHSQPFAQHQSHGTILASANTTTLACLGTWACPVVGFLALTFINLLTKHGWCLTRLPWLSHFPLPTLIHSHFLLP